MTSITMLFGIQGRITRAQYWGWSLGLTAVLGGIFLASAIAFNKLSDGGESAQLAFFLLSTPLYALHGWCSVCISAKRCHDRNRSAWYLLMGIIPVIGGLILLIDLGCKDGTQGPNRFGLSPKGIVGADVSEAFA